MLGTMENQSCIVFGPSRSTRNGEANGHANFRISEKWKLDYRFCCNSQNDELCYGKWCFWCLRGGVSGQDSPQNGERVPLMDLDETQQDGVGP